MPAPADPARTPPGGTPRERIADAVKDLVSDIKHQREEEAQERRREAEHVERKARRRWFQLALAALVFAISAIVAVPRWKTPFRPPAGAAADRHARQALRFAAGLVESFRARHGRLPTSLAETGLVPAGVEYRIVGEGWELRLSTESGVVRLPSEDYRR
jgi:hypothetical protein